VDVLVVEDEALVALALTDLLGRWGFSSIRVASSEHDAQLEIMRRRPDLLVTDIRLGRGGDGVSLGRWARLVHPTLPVVYISASFYEPANPAYEIKLSKPLDPGLLLAALSMLGALPRQTSQTGHDTTALSTRRGEP
jgi:DNA-binding response OmpR family regulator